MQKMANTMSTALGSMDIVQVNESIGNFEKMFDNLEIHSELMEKAMDNIDAGSYAEKDVSNLITQIAIQNNLEMQDEFADVKMNSTIDKEKVGNKQSLNNLNV